jgi:beta-lactamase superfamily II metal-dependent hydrolase
LATLVDLSVGCANCAVLRSGDSCLIVDCSGIAAHARELPASRHIDALIVTHQHYDHFDGLGYLYEQGFSIGLLLYSPYIPRKDEGSVASDEWESFEELKALFAQRGSELAAPYGRPGLVPPFRTVGDMDMAILGPPESLARSESRSIHDACLVVLVSTKSSRVIFAGDASAASLEWIARSSSDFACDVLHASHHGGAEGAVEAFVRGASPRTTVVSTASGVYPELPSAAALSLYAAHTRGRVLRTDIEGNLRFSL